MESMNSNPIRIRRGHSLPQSSEYPHHITNEPFVADLHHFPLSARAGTGCTVTSQLNDINQLYNTASTYRIALSSILKLITSPKIKNHLKMAEVCPITS